MDILDAQSRGKTQNDDSLEQLGSRFVLVASKDDEVVLKSVDLPSATPYSSKWYPAIGVKYLPNVEQRACIAPRDV